MLVGSTSVPGVPPVTSDGDALFRAICEQPWEDTPRLMYADWLDENGDPLRAEFIRVQVQLAKEGEQGELKELRARAEQLHRKAGGRWTRGSPAGGGVRIGRELRRGFYYKASFSGYNPFVQRSAKVFEWMPVDTLWVDWIPDEMLTNVLQSQYLLRIINFGISVHATDITCERVADCPHLANLEELALPGSELTDRGALVLLNSPNLKRLKTLHLKWASHLSVWVVAFLKDRFKNFTVQ
jgi:uncharacterized protein (TIGR02996 family)